MLRASAESSAGQILIAGLSERNIEQLKAGQPIDVDLATFKAKQPGRLLIFYGQTEPEMEATLRQHTLISKNTQTITDPDLIKQYDILKQGKTLIATVGLPRSGKSTWAKKEAWPVVNPDSIRLALTGQKFVAVAEPFVWATAKLMVRSLFLAGHNTVILDATNTTRARRDDWKSTEWQTRFKFFETDAEECKRRAKIQNNASGHPLADEEIIPVIERMNANFESLGIDELKWD